MDVPKLKLLKYSPNKKPPIKVYTDGEKAFVTCSSLAKRLSGRDGDLPPFVKKIIEQNNIPVYMFDWITSKENARCLNVEDVPKLLLLISNCPDEQVGRKTKFALATRENARKFAPKFSKTYSPQIRSAMRKIPFDTPARYKGEEEIEQFDTLPQFDEQPILREIKREQTDSEISGNELSQAIVQDVERLAQKYGLTVTDVMNINTELFSISWKTLMMIGDFINVKEAG